jgi:PAS domain S-box-containing protein
MPSAGQLSTALSPDIDENLTQFIERVPDAMILSDPKGRIVTVNTNIERMFGYSRDELLGKEVEILVPPGSRSIHQKERFAYYADPSISKDGGRARAIGL